MAAGERRLADRQRRHRDRRDADYRRALRRLVREGDEPATDAACSSAISGTTHALATLSAGTTYAYTAYRDAACADAIGSAAFTTGATLTASSVTATGATLTIAGHTGGWHYRADTGPDTSCAASAVTGATKTLTGLSPGTAYTYSAYSDSACATLLATASSFTTADTLTASNVTDTGATLTFSGSAGWYYQADTGPDTSCSASAVTGATKTLTGLSPGTAYTYSAYSDSACATLLATAGAFTTLASLTAGNLADTTATLTIAGHTGDWYLKKTAPTPAGTCSSAISGTTRNLSSLTRNTTYTYEAYSDSACATMIATVTFSTLPSTLSAGSVSNTSATLTIGHHTGNWYVKETSPSTTASCSSAGSGATHDLSGLTDGVRYVYRAYSDSACTTAITAGASFDTTLYPPTNVSVSSTCFFGACSITARWDRNSSTTGSVGYGLEVYEFVWSHWQTVSPTTDASFTRSGTHSGNAIRVRAFRTTGGVTIWSVWVQNN